ncbi:hypothetical protein V2J09_014653 [Rumex salicifolius]
MKSLVLKLNIRDIKDKKNAIKAISSFDGVDAIVANSKEGTITVVGDIDPAVIEMKMRKKWDAHSVTVGPAVEFVEQQIAQFQRLPVYPRDSYDYSYNYQQPYFKNPNNAIAANNYQQTYEDNPPNTCVIS